MGDFNYILLSKDKIGGNLTPIVRMLDFRDCVTNSRLMELSHTSQKYTWFNLQSNNIIFSEIDRMFL